uniref:Microtubule-associated protein Jupiter n=1 Tax=Cuerna arida TaxID=1464854 RepID=A0A1B6FTJ2_9HEMI
MFVIILTCNMFGSDNSNRSVNQVSRRRVLKPPGGGSSDIFGTSAEPTEPQRKTRTHLTSSIFGEETVTPSRNKADGGNPVASNGPAVNGASESSASTPAPTPAPAAKQRVPPGGFSSGLW